MMSVPTDTRKEIIGAIEKLPAELLPTVAQFVRKIQVGTSSPNQQDVPPYQPVALGGLWQGVEITEEDIASARSKAWARFGELSDL